MTSMQQFVAVLVVAGGLLLVYLLQPILAPFLTGIILGYLGDPLVDRLERLRIPRTPGVILVFGLFCLIISAAVLVILPMLAREIASLLRTIPLALEWLQGTFSPWLVENFGVDPFNVKLDSLATTVMDNWESAGGLLGSVLSNVTQSGFALLNALAMIGLTPVVAFYLMRDWDVIIARIHEIIPREIEPTVVRLAHQCDEVLGAFLRGQLLIMFLLGCIYAAGLYLVGLDLAILIGMLAGLASIVPYLGFVVGIIAATIAALFQFQELIFIGYVVIVFGIGQALEGWVLTPWLVGDRIGLHPVAVIFAVLAGGQLFGFVGVLLALPVAAVIMVFVRYLHDRYIRSEYYSRGASSAEEPEQ